MKRTPTLILGFLIALSLNAQIDARLFQYPDVSKSHIAFIYGGDVWVVGKSGGLATKLSSPKGTESFPKFSPDGSEIAFSGNYDGNTDIYVMSVQGGVPTRVTHHGMNDRIMDWHPSGDKVLYASGMESGKQRFSQFYTVSKTGGLPEKLPIAYGEFASYSADGKQVAYVDRSRVFRTWKRYRGGTAADVWIFNLETLASENVTDHIANDELPMWAGDKVYYLSDKGPNERFNLWKYDTKTKLNSQVTNFVDDDVHFPSNGPEDIVFEAGGKLYLLNLSTEEYKEVKVQIVSDQMAIRPHNESVEKYLQSASISPDGKRVVVEARGEIFSLPAEEGFTQNLTRSSGFAERSPAWSPNGRYIAYWSDQSGEYELTIRDMQQGAKEEKVSSLGPGFRYNLYWSPDSEKLAFVDQTMTINVFDMTTKMAEKVDQDLALFEGGLRNWRPAWSSDSQWMAYAKSLDNGNNAIFIYNSNDKKSIQATNGFYSDMSPSFDPSGKFLFVATNRAFRPVYSDFDNTWTYPNATQLAAIALQPDVASPLMAKNDTVAIKMEDKKEDNKEEEDKKDEEKADEKAVKIEFEGLERRLIILPPHAGNLGQITAVDGKVVFMRYPNSGTEAGKSKLMYFDLKEREEKTIANEVNDYEISSDGKKYW